MQLNLVDDYQAANKPIQSLATVLDSDIKFFLTDDFSADSIDLSIFSSQNINLNQSKIQFILTDDFLANSLNPEILFVKYDPAKIQYKANFNLIDDFFANSLNADNLFVQYSPDHNNAIKVVITDDFFASSLEIESLFVQYNPSQYQNILFSINIEDDYAKANDEYVLITEDGLVIALEDYHNQDEIAIIVR